MSSNSVNDVEVNFNNGYPLRIYNKNNDVVVVTLDPITQEFNITTEGNPVVNIDSKVNTNSQVNINNITVIWMI